MEYEMTGVPQHRLDPDYHTCWCGKPWPCNLPGQRQRTGMPVAVLLIGGAVSKGGSYRRAIEEKWPSVAFPVGTPSALGVMRGERGSTPGPKNDTDARVFSGALKRVGRKRKPQGRFRRWLRKQLTRTIARLEHGHGPGTLTRFGGTHPGYTWKCGRCGGKAEW